MNNYYRIKTEWIHENEDGQLSKVKTEELAHVSSYTEAESVAYALIENQRRSQYTDANIEITKTKISEIIYNSVLDCDSNLINGLVCNFFKETEDTGAGLYAVKVVYYEEDERSGKTKKTNETIYVPATSNTDASYRIEEFLKNDMRHFVIRDIKFDNAEAILWTSEVHKRKSNVD